jgi:glyoxylase-like metal-dependent hydrolase (beta-lactamase superfamily II)
VRATLARTTEIIVMTGIEWTALSDGWTAAPEAAVLPGGSWRKPIRFHAVAFLLRHPEMGPVLVDTGYSRRFFTETAAFPARIYRGITKVTLTDEGGIASQLARIGVAAEEVKHVVITHFHADHIGGLRDFPEATFHCSEAAHDSVKGVSGFAAVRHAFLPGLLPPDFAERVRYVKEGDILFPGMSVIDLPGHATGQIGLRFTGADGVPVLLAADACWLSAAYRENRMPHAVTRLLHDWPAYRSTLERLHALHLNEPTLKIVPTHCPETAALLK